MHRVGDLVVARMSGAEHIRVAQGEAYWSSHMQLGDFHLQGVGVIREVTDETYCVYSIKLTLISCAALMLYVGRSIGEEDRVYGLACHNGILHNHTEVLRRKSAASKIQRYYRNYKRRQWACSVLSPWVLHWAYRPGGLCSVSYH